MTGNTSDNDLKNKAKNQNKGYFLPFGQSTAKMMAVLINEPWRIKFFKRLKKIDFCGNHGNI